MPDMREKVIEYVNKELEEEIARCIQWVEDEENKKIDVDEYGCLSIKSRIETLTEVQNDLKNRLEELI